MGKMMFLVFTIIFATTAQAKENNCDRGQQESLLIKTFLWESISPKRAQEWTRSQIVEIQKVQKERFARLGEQVGGGFGAPVGPNLFFSEAVFRWGTISGVIECRGDGSLEVKRGSWTIFQHDGYAGLGEL